MGRLGCLQLSKLSLPRGEAKGGVTRWLRPQFLGKALHKKKNKGESPSGSPLGWALGSEEAEVPTALPAGRDVQPGLSRALRAATFLAPPGRLAGVHSAASPAVSVMQGFSLRGEGRNSDTEAGVLVPRSAAVHCWQQ